MIVAPTQTGEFEVGEGVPGIALTVMVTTLELAVVEVTQVAFEVKIHVTICPFVSVEEL